MICRNRNGIEIQIDDLDAQKYLVQDKKGNWKFSLNSRGYACISFALNGESRKSHLLHRVLMSAPQDLQVDHRNNDKLDNRRQNLRICSISQNKQNVFAKGRSKYLGVWFDKAINKWTVQARIDGRKRTIGRFADEKLAAKARDKAVVEANQFFCKLNFPEDYPNFGA